MTVAGRGGGAAVSGGFVGLFFGLEGKHAIGPLEIRIFSVDATLDRRAGGTGVAAGAVATGPRRRRDAWCASPRRLPRSRRSWRSGCRSARSRACSVTRCATRRSTLAVRLRAGGQRPARAGALCDDRDAVPVDAAAYGYRALATARWAAWLCRSWSARSLIESAAVPLPLNGEAVAAATTSIRQPSFPPRRPPLTRAIDALPRDAVLLELPFGEPAWEIRYVYHSIFHWRRLVNGYSGDVPARYVRHARRALPAARGRRRPRVAARSPQRRHPRPRPRATPSARRGRRRMRAWIEAHGGQLLASVPTRPWIYALSCRSRPASARR